MDSLRLRVALKRFDKYAKMVADVGGMIVHVSSKPTLLGAFGAALHVGGKFVAGHVNALKHTPSWPTITLPIRVEDLDRFADPHLSGLFHIGGQRVYQQKKNGVFYVERDPKAFLSSVKDLLWKDRTHLLFRGTSEGDPLLTADEPQKSKTSPRTEEIWSRIDPCIQAGLPRSALLQGPPGVGKSTAARVLVARVPGPSLRVIMGDHLDLGDLESVVEILEPSTIVVDDFDRMGPDAMSLLDFLESCRVYVRLLVVTSNRIGALDPAVLRPGRFDEIFYMESLGPEYLRPQIGEELWSALSEEQRSQIVQWPAAHLNELRIRFKHISSDLQKEFEDLSKRVSLNRQEHALHTSMRRRPRRPRYTEEMVEEEDSSSTTDFLSEYMG